MAAITPAPKLLRHLEASLVPLCRRGDQRDGQERRRAGEVKETEKEGEGERTRENSGGKERDGSRVR